MKLKDVLAAKGRRVVSVSAKSSVADAIRSEQTDMPLDVERSSGSRVRLPVRTTRLMFVAATEGSFRLLRLLESSFRRV